MTRAFTADLGVRLRLFTWLTQRVGAIAVSRMSPRDIARARARRFSHNLVTSQVFGALPRDVTIGNRRADTDAGTLAVRLYRPREVAPRGLVVNFHGGGGTLGNLDYSDWFCAHVASRTGALVVSVDYRLAPEHPHPAAIEDGYAALVWAARHAAELGVRDPRIAVMGDSAGGTLATVVAHIARDAGPDLDAQILLYPPLDLEFGTESIKRYAEGPMLTRADIDAFRANYLGSHGDPLDPMCSPMHAPDVSGLPPTLVITARIDLLHDDGVAYAERLHAAGVPTRHVDYVRAVHGFITFPGVCPAAFDALDEVCGELRARLHPEPARMAHM